MKKWLPVAVAILISSTLVLAGTIKVWGSGDLLTSTDLNANFAHIHNTMVGGHGSRLINADVHPLAAIAHSKMATPTLIPKMVVGIGTPSPSTVCSVNGTCAQFMAAGLPVTVTRTAAGVYGVTWTVVRPNQTYLPLVNMVFAAGPGYCGAQAPLAAGFTVQCKDTTGTSQDAVVAVSVYDDDP